MKIKFGKVKVYAHRLMNGEPIPIFNDNKVNRMIDRHCGCIKKARTNRRYIK